MTKQNLQEKVDELRNSKSESLNSLISHMLKKGYSLKQWKNLNYASEKVISALSEYFTNTESDLAVSLDEDLNKGNQNINLNELKELGALAKKTSKQTSKTKEVENTNKTIETEPVKETAIETTVGENTAEPVNESEVKTEPVNEVEPVKEEKVEGNDTNEDKLIEKEVSATETNPSVDGSSALSLDNPTSETDIKEVPSEPANTVPAPATTENDTPAPANSTPAPTPTGNATPANVPANSTSAPANVPATVPTTNTTTTTTTTPATPKKPRKPSDKPHALTTSQIKRLYKTVDNIHYLVPSKEVVLKDVRKINDTKYVTYLNGRQLAEMWLENKLVFNPTMQRGIKQNAKGDMVATFSDHHVGEIEASMLKGEFEPTQIHFAIATDDNETTFEFDEESDTFIVKGHVNLLDGQHRLRSLVKIVNNMNVDPKNYPKINIEYYLFCVEIHVVPSQRARVIYSMIDKNLRLDKSQVRQLSVDDYATIVNYLNLDSKSPLRDKIAPCKPVGKALVLFSTLAEAIEQNVTINIPSDRTAVQNYLVEFFTYLTQKMEDAFGGSHEKRLKFKENNLLNENNFFRAWIAVAYKDKNNFKNNIDKIVANVDYFKKNNKIWLDGQAVKYKASDKDKPESEKGFAMSNSTTAFDTLINRTLELIGK